MIEEGRLCVAEQQELGDDDADDFQRQCALRTDAAVEPARKEPTDDRKAAEDQAVGKQMQRLPAHRARSVDADEDEDACQPVGE